MIALLALSLLTAAAPPAVPTPPPAPADTVPDARLAFDRALARDVFALLRANGVARPTGKLELTTDSARTAVAPRLLDSDMPDSAVAGLTALLAERVSRAPGSGPVMLSLRLDAGSAFDEPDSLGGRPRDVNRPRAGNAQHVVDLLLQMFAASNHSRNELRHGLDATIRLRLDADGNVAMVDVVRATGNPDMDRSLMPVAYQLRFRPAMAGGRPVPVWTDVPLHWFTR